MFCCIQKKVNLFSNKLRKHNVFFFSIYLMNKFSSREEPTLISALSGKNIVSISSGSSHCAAISVEGDLYTWGRGNHGRLGHGM